MDCDNDLSQWLLLKQGKTNIGKITENYIIALSKIRNAKVSAWVTILIEVFRINCEN